MSPIRAVPQPFSAETLGLSEPVLRAIKRKGYRLPTPIQRKTLPLILQARAVERGCNKFTGAAAQQIGCSCSQRVLAVGQRSGRELPLILQARVQWQMQQSGCFDGRNANKAAHPVALDLGCMGLHRVSMIESNSSKPLCFPAGPGCGGHGPHRLRQAPLLCPVASGSPSVHAAPLR